MIGEANDRTKQEQNFAFQVISMRLFHNRKQRFARMRL